MKSKILHTKKFPGDADVWEPHLENHYSQLSKFLTYIKEKHKLEMIFMNIDLWKTWSPNQQTHTTRKALGSNQKTAHLQALKENISGMFA